MAQDFENLKHLQLNIPVLEQDITPVAVQNIEKDYQSGKLNLPEAVQEYTPEELQALEQAKRTVGVQAQKLSRKERRAKKFTKAQAREYQARQTEQNAREQANITLGRKVFAPEYYSGTLPTATAQRRASWGNKFGNIFRKHNRYDYVGDGNGNWEKDTSGKLNYADAYVKNHKNQSAPKKLSQKNRGYSPAYGTAGITKEQANALAHPGNKQTFSLPNFSFSNLFQDNSQTEEALYKGKKDAEAIHAFKTHNKTTDPYWVFDKDAGKIGKYIMGKEVYSVEGMSGMHPELAGFIPMPKGRLYDNTYQSRSTPEGIFTAHSSSYAGKPAIRFIAPERGQNPKYDRDGGSQVSMHILPSARTAAFNAGKRTGSFGCWGVPTVEQLPAQGDSLYVIGGNPDVYTEVRDGHLQQYTPYTAEPFEVKNHKDIAKGVNQINTGY